ncbi:MAG TPA: hypothetical protein VHJ20_05800, partial [Polyangia bacterium]|nr:hypothetical protein [Polyangia bacterium]
MSAPRVMKSGAAGPRAAREEQLRRAIDAATDAGVRARLNVQLAELLRLTDVAAAGEALRRAATDAPALPVVTLAGLSLARSLPGPARLALLTELVASA